MFYKTAYSVHAISYMIRKELKNETQITKQVPQIMLYKYQRNDGRKLGNAKMVSGAIQYAHIRMPNIKPKNIRLM
jgi:hypothetical protein